MEKCVDIVVMGATGFTGKCVVKMLAALTKEKYCDVTWAIAGRSKEKLENLSMDLNNQGVAVNNWHIIESDIKNEESLHTMLAMAKVVINCTGPNCFLSPPIVKACIATGTHYVDMSAEKLHILGLYRDYHKDAEDAKVLIIPSCGLVSLPFEIGILYLEQHFQSILHSVECYAECTLPSWRPGQVMVHNGTWQTTIQVMETSEEHLALWQKMFPSTKSEPKESAKSYIHLHNGRFWIRYPGPDVYTAELTQKYLNEKTHKSIVHIKGYATIQNLFYYIFIFILFLYYYLCYFKWFRSLLVNTVRLFTAAMASSKGPNYQTRQFTKFKYTFNGEGWEKNDDLKRKPTKYLSIKFSGQDPYNATAIAIISSAITILKERANMPMGGVIMPGAAFYKTNIIDRLMSDGHKYKALTIDSVTNNQ